MPQSGVPAILPFEPPVVLAPMAGITNRAFRMLCRQAGTQVSGRGSAGLYVTEMVTSRALLERHPETLEMIRFAPQESPRSGQLYEIGRAHV